MGPAGHLVTIKRSGVDGPHFPLTLSTCLFGRGIECDIRIQLPVVSKQHCKIEIKEQKAILFNFSSTNPTQVNGSIINEPVQLKHGDVITIVDRSFRYENESHPNGSRSAGSPGQKRAQASPRRVSRSSFPPNPDGGVHDPRAHPKLTEEGDSGGPLALSGDVRAARPTSHAAEEPLAGETPTAHGSELPGGHCRHAGGPTAGGTKEGSSVTSPSRNGESKAFPSAQCRQSSGENESPFRKLYESMKEELDVKPGSRRKSGSRSHCTAGNENTGGLQGKTPLLVTPKSRRRSSQSTQVQADPASKAKGSGQTEEERVDAGAVQTPKVPMSPSASPTGVTKAKTPAQRSHPSPSWRRQSGDLSAIHGSESVNLGPGEGFRAKDSALMPRTSLTRNQTPAQGESAAFGNTPEKASRKRRRSSLPAGIDVLTIDTEIQKHAALAPLLIQAERKVPDGSLGTPEPLGATAGQRRPSSPGLRSVDVSNIGDSTNTVEGMPLKRRRVSFGGHLRPELFDENLPPNTPLKRGETPLKRRSLVTRTPTVLKKIIKEQPQPSGKEDSSGVPLGGTTPNVFLRPPACRPNDGRQRSPETSSASSGSKSLRETDAPKGGGRRSTGGPPRRSSTDRSQQETLQMIRSKRRSGASDANLLVAKSWADVVKLSAKQTQTKVPKRGPRRQLNKRCRRMNTPKKPVGTVHNQFSTGHANSPYTIVIGKAHLEKVSVPARPYRTLNSFVFNKKIDFSEDLSGLTEMFKTPKKEKPQMISICPITFSNSEDLLTKTFQVPNSEEKSLLHIPKHFVENVSPRTQNAQEQTSAESSASLTLRRQCCIVQEHLRTPPSKAEPAKVASSANKFRRSTGLRNTQVPGAEQEDEDKDANTAENILGRHLRKTPQREEKLEEEMKKSESYFKTSKSKETSEKVVAVRRSRRSSELKCAPEDRIALKRLQETEVKEDLGNIQPLLQTPGQRIGPVDAENRVAVMCRTSPRPDPGSTPTKVSTQIKTPSRKVSTEEPSAHGKPTGTPRETTHSPREPGADDKDIRAVKETPEQQMDPTESGTGSRRRSRTPKRKAQLQEDLVGFKELFQTPNHSEEPVTDDKTTKIARRSPLADAVHTPMSIKSRRKTPLGKVDAEEGLSALGQPTQTPGGTTCSHREPEGDDKDIKLLKETLEQKLEPIKSVTGSKRRSRTPKRKVQALEDLAGFKELFQTPNHTMRPVTDDKTTQIPHTSPKPEPVDTPTSTESRLKTPLGKVDTEVEFSALRDPTQTPGSATHSHREPGGGDKDIQLFKETAEQKLEPIKSVTGSRRRSRTPKRKVQLLEDLAGFKELFQTPDHTDEPMTGDTTTQMLCQSPQPEPVITSTRMTRWLKTAPRKVNGEQELSALGEPTWTPGETPWSPKEPEGGDKDIKLFRETLERNLDPPENLTVSKKRSRTPKRKVQALEDLTGFRELFQTPDHSAELVTGDKTTKILHGSPQEEAVNTLTSRKSHLKTPRAKVDAEEGLSALRKPTQTPGGTTCSHREPEGDDKDIKLFKEIPEQKLEPIESVTGSKRRSRTPKRKSQLQEDLVGFKELFQTPNHSEEPVTDDKTTKIARRSPLADAVHTPMSIKSRRKTPLGKVDAEEGLSALGQPTQTPGGTTCSHREPEGDDKDIKLLKETLEQKLEPIKSVTGSKRRSRTPKRKVQALEDLAGFKELFQTPNHTMRPVTDDKTTQIPHTSPKPEPVDTPTSTESRLKTPLGKVDTEVEFSALRDPTQTPGSATHSHREPGGGDKDIQLFKETAEQKLEPIKSVTGSRRRSRTPKRKVQLLEDLAGFKELFQTPDHTDEPMTGDTTTQMLCQSPQPEPVITSTRMTRWLKTAPRKVNGEQELSALGEPTWTPGETPWSPKEPEGGDKDIKLFRETLERNLDPPENLTVSKKRSRTPKRKVQALEDLTGFRELFQTPDHSAEPVTGDTTTKILHRSPQEEAVNILTSRKSHLKTPLVKVDAEEGLSALRKPTQTPGGTTCSHREPEGDDKDIKLFKEIPEQKLEPIESVTGSKRRSRTPKRKAQLQEDLVGFKELFQTPNHSEEPVTDDKTTKIARRSPLADAVHTPMSIKSRRKTPLGKVDAEEGLSALGQPTQTPGGTTRSHREPEGDDKDIKLLKETPEQKLEPIKSVTGRKRRSRTPKRKVQALEDLTGFRELFQTPDHSAEPVTGDKTKIPHTSPNPEAVNTPASTESRRKTPLGKVDAEEGLSALGQPTQTPGGTARSHREPEGDGKDIGTLRETPGQKLDSAENVTGSWRRSRTPKRKARPLEDLAGFKELFQTPDHAVEPVTGDTTTQMPCRPPQAEPVMPTGRKRRLKAPPGKVGAKGELPAPRKPTQTSRRTTRSPREPEREANDIELSKETAEQKMDPAERVTRSKRKARTPKEKAQPLEDPTGPKELSQAPGHPDEPGTVLSTTRTRGQSAQPAPVTKPASKNRRPQAPPGKAAGGEEPPVLRRSTRAGRGTHSYREPGDSHTDDCAWEGRAGPSRDPAEKAPGSRRQPGSREGKAPPLEGLAACPELSRTAGQDPTQTPDGRQPAKRPRRVLRAPDAEPVEDLAGSRDPVEPPSECSVPLAPKRKCGADGSVTGRKRLRATTSPRDAAQEMPRQKRQRTAARQRRQAPEPLVVGKESRGIWAGRPAAVGDLPSDSATTTRKGRKAGAGTPPAKVTGMSLRSRRPKTTGGAEPTPEFLVSAEKTKPKRSEKEAPHTCQEGRPQRPDGGATTSPSAGRGLGRKTRLRSGGHTAGQDSRVRATAPKEKEGTKRVGFVSLRARKPPVPPAGDTVEKGSEQRVTRSATRSAEDVTKEKDNVCVKKIRTRSRRDREDV